MDYILKTGIIEGTRTVLDSTNPASGPSTFSVRILPDMMHITDIDSVTKKLLLPDYPNFFKEVDYAYQVGEMVWVVCSVDFQVGFILGYLNPYNGTDITSIVKQMKHMETLAGLSSSEMSSSADLTVTKLSDNYLTVFNVHTGTTLQVYNSRIYYLFCSDGTLLSSSGNYYTKINKDGEVTIQGKSLKESYTKDINITGGKLNEVYSSVTTSTQNDISLIAGGGLHITTALGGVSIMSGTNVSITSGTMISLIAPIIGVIGFPIIL